MNAALNVLQGLAALAVMTDLLAVVFVTQNERPIGLAMSLLVFRPYILVCKCLTYVFGYFKWVYGTLALSAGAWMFSIVNNIWNAEGTGEYLLFCVVHPLMFLAIFIEFNLALQCRKRIIDDITNHQTVTLETVKRTAAIGSMIGSTVIYVALLTDYGFAACGTWVLHGITLLACISQVTPPKRTLKNDAKNVVDRVAAAMFPTPALTPATALSANLATNYKES